jgi:hypothetical protein
MASVRVPTRVPDFLLERLDGELLLYHPGRTQTILLNETASIIWELCNGVRSEQEISALLVEAFPDAADSLARDVEATLCRFVDEGAIAFT